jgi:hypothetical protein
MLKLMVRRLLWENGLIASGKVIGKEHCVSID